MGDKITVQVAEDQFDKLARVTTPVAGVEQLIWNSLDAEAQRVTVSFEQTSLGAVAGVAVEDDGHGMTFDEAQRAFGDLGGSWKRSRALTKNNLRSLHGRDGEGRFRAFSLGKVATWSSVAATDDGVSKVTIEGSTEDRRFDISSESVPPSTATGTTVRTSSPRKYVRKLLAPDARVELVTRLASFLSRYPDVVVEYDGERLTVESILLNTETIPLDPLTAGQEPVVVEVMQWDAKVKPSILVCGRGGVIFEEITDGVPTEPNVFFTAYLHWDGFDDHRADLLLGDTGHPVLQPIFDNCRTAIGRYLAKRRDAEHVALIQKWRDDNVYPYFGEPSTPLQIAERRVFDAIAVRAADSLAGGTKSTKLSLRLMKEALEQNPGALHTVLEDVLSLTNEQVEDFATILKRTPLAAVISTTRTVTDRLEFLDQLQCMLFDADKRPHLRERAQLHRVLAERTWVFGEEYALAVSDRSLTKVLEAHVTLTGAAVAIDRPVKDSGGRARVVDLMLSRAIKEGRRRRHLIVELKRPTVKLGSREVDQVMNYADAVAADERFGMDAEWDFILVGNTMDERVRKEVTQNGRERGLRSDPHDSNYRVWVKEWNEILEENRQRLHFFEKILQFTPDTEQSLTEMLDNLLPSNADSSASGSSLSATAAQPGRCPPNRFSCDGS